MTDEVSSPTDNSNKEIINKIKQDINNNDELANNIESINDISYQPLSYDTYKFFVKFSPFVEKILLNNINKYILQGPQDLQELKAFSKLEKEFMLSNDLIEYLNMNNFYNHEVFFNSNFNI